MKIRCHRNVGLHFLAGQSNDKHDFRPLQGKLREDAVLDVDDDLAEVLISRGIASREIKAPAAAPDIAKAAEKATEDLKSYRDRQLAKEESKTEAAAKK